VRLFVERRALDLEPGEPDRVLRLGTLGLFLE
jgi:hypothetical protein